MEIHPCLTRPHAPVLRRPDGSVQIGVGAAALHLPGVSPAEARWLATLDGTRPLPQVLAEGAVHGVGDDRAADLVDQLVADGHVVLGRAAPTTGRVGVVGHGALPSLLADVLGHAGVPEVGRTSRSHPGDAHLDLVVLTATVPPATHEARAWTRRGAAVLPLVCGPTHATVGPLLLPGAGPCLHCLELTRAHMDPGWTWLRAQLSRPHVGPEAPVDGQAPVRLLAAGLTTSLVLDHLGGSPPQGGWAYDVALPGPTFERHRWEVHPECPTCADGPGERDAATTLLEEAG